MKHQAKKRFGQNFLTDKNLLIKIVNEAKIKEQNVCEIGPGLGALTQYLVKDAKRYLGYEIDYSLKNHLLSNYQGDHTKFIFDDFLSCDITNDLASYFNGEPVSLVANLPYYITTPIIFKFLEIKQLQSATIMVQKEVGERLISKSNQKSYNALSAILQYYANVTKVIDVNRKLFKPVPKVDSMVIKIDKISLNNTNEALYLKFVKAIFIHKRKQAINNLSEVFDISKDKLRVWFADNGYDPNIRAEQLSVKELIDLTNNWPFQY